MPNCGKRRVKYGVKGHLLEKSSSTQVLSQLTLQFSGQTSTFLFSF